MTSIPTDPDRDVLALAGAGQVREAHDRLVRRHGAAVRRLCGEALRDAALADDVHQQVFLEALRDLPGLRPRASLRGWLLGIARHRVIDAMRVRNRARARASGVAVCDLADPGASPGDQLDDAARLRTLSACVRALPPAVATAVVLRYQRGLSFDEMAILCGARATTLQARVARALPRLRQELERRSAGYA